MINRPRGLSKPELKLGKGWPRTFNNAVQELSIVAQTLEEFVLGRRRIQRKRERERRRTVAGAAGKAIWKFRLASAKWKSVFRSFIAFFIIPEKENALLP